MAEALGVEHVDILVAVADLVEEVGPPGIPFLPVATPQNPVLGSAAAELQEGAEVGEQLHHQSRSGVEAEAGRIHNVETA